MGGEAGYEPFLRGFFFGQWASSVTLRVTGALYQKLTLADDRIAGGAVPSILPACRALFVQGIIGKLSLCDGKTGKPRTIIDIERAAKLTVEEGGGARRSRKYRERGGSEGYSPEEAVARKEAA